ncbi:MAG: universal stress protein, partial [Nitrospirae bacterium]|nr:universal stress protein [Nitrospirota bacterium]
GKVFRFKQQEQLHEEIIDDGLAKIYKAHLEVAKSIAKEKGIEVKTTLLAGKPYDAILGEIRKADPDLLILGKVGIHKDDGLDIGSNGEKLLRLAPCHVLLTSRTFVPPVELVAEQTVSWTKEAEKRMERVPGFVKNMARMAILKYAQEKGHTVISSSLIDEAMGKFMPQGAMGSAGAGKCPHGSSSEDEKMGWDEDAMEELRKIGDTTVREQVRLRVEKRVRMKGAKSVRREDVIT